MTLLLRRTLILCDLFNEIFKTRNWGVTGVAWFMFLKSIQTLRVPFFLTTGTILANQSKYLAVLMKPHFSGLSTSSLIFA